MHHQNLHRVFIQSVCLLLMFAGIGCEPEYSRRQTIDLRDRILDIKDHHGGTRHISLVNGDQWYQSYGHAIEILDSDDGLRISLIENGPFGSIGPISDMIIANNSLWVVHANDRVVQMDLSNPRRPIAGKQWTAEELGLLPLEVSSAGGMIWISGRNGVTSLQRPGVMYLKDGNRAGRVVEQGRTLVATSGRRIKELRSSKYLGAATELHQIDGIPALSDGFFFVLQGDSAATIGIMNDSFAELDSETVRGTCRSLRMFGDALFAVTDTEIFGWEACSFFTTSSTYTYASADFVVPSAGEVRFDSTSSFADFQGARIVSIAGVDTTSTTAFTSITDVTSVCTTNSACQGVQIKIQVSDWECKSTSAWAKFRSAFTAAHSSGSVDVVINARTDAVAYRNILDERLLGNEDPDGTNAARDDCRQLHSSIAPWVRYSVY